MSPGTSGFHLGEDLFNVGFDCMCPREDGSHERFLSRTGNRGSRSYQGSLLTLSNTHPAAPAIPSPRRRETSFSLPRRMDSRNLENELLRRRVWGGHRGHPSAPIPATPHSQPGGGRIRHPHLSCCVTGRACGGGSWGTDGGRCGGDTEKPPGGEGLGAHREGRAGPPC